MSRYRGPRFKKIRRLGALPGLTSKRPRAGSDLSLIRKPLDCITLSKFSYDYLEVCLACTILHVLS